MGVGSKYNKQVVQARFSSTSNEAIRKNHVDLLLETFISTFKRTWKIKGIEKSFTPLACPFLQNPFLHQR